MRKILAAKLFTAILFALTAGVTAQTAAAQPTFQAQFSPTTIAPDSVSTLIFTIENGSSTPIRELAFTNVLPAGLTIASPAGAASTCLGGSLTAPDGGSTLTYSDGSIGIASTCSISVNVTGTTAAVYSNVSGALTSDAGNSGTATASLTINAAAPGFSKSLSATVVDRFDRVTMTYTIDNTANASALGGIAFSETLPAGVAIASPANLSTTCGGANASKTLTASAGGSTLSVSIVGYTFAGSAYYALDPNASCTVQVDIAPSSSGTFALESSNLNYNTGGGNLTSGKSLANLTVNTLPTSDVNLIKRFARDSVSPDEVVDLEFTLLNPNSTDAMSGIAFTDDLDAMLSGAVAVSLPSAPCGPGSTLSGTANLTLTGGTLDPRGTCSFTVGVQVPAGAAAGTYVNTTGAVDATVGGRPVTGPAATDSLTVLQGAAAILSAEFTDDPVQPGNVATLVYTIENPNGSLALSDLAFRHEMQSVGTNAFPSLAANTCMGTVVAGSLGTDLRGVVLTGGSVAAGATCTITVNVTVLPATFPGDYTDTTTAITGAFPDTGGFVGNTATATLQVGAADPLYGLQMNKTFGSSYAAVGDTVELRFALQNGSTTVTANQLSFTDDLAAFRPGTTLAAVSSDTCGGSASGLGTGTFTYTGGSIAPSNQCEIVVDVTLGGSATGTFTNTTSVLSGAADAGPVNALSGTAASDSLIVNDYARPTVTTEFLPTPTLAGASITLRVTIDNPNSVEASAISLLEPLGAGLSNLAATSLPATPCGAGSSLSGTEILILSGGNIPANDSCVFDVTVLVPVAATTGSYRIATNSGSATLGGNAYSLDPAVSYLELQNDPLTLTKTFLDDPAAPGDTVTLRFKLENVGSGTSATNIAFTDDLDAMLAGATLAGSLPTAPCGAGSVLSGGGSGLLALSGGTVAAGASCTFDVTLQVPLGAAAGSYTNTTSTASYDFGSLTGRSASAATDTLNVSSIVAPSFSKSFSESDVAAGATVDLSFTIQNNDTVNALADLAFTDDLSALPSGTVATILPSAPCGAGSAISGSSLLTFTSGTLAAGQSCTITVSLQLPANAAAGSYVNTSSELYNGGLVVAAEATDTLTVAPAPTFAKAFAPDTADVEQPVTLTFTIDNTGASLAAGSLDFTDNLPAGMTVATSSAASTTCTGGTLTATTGSGTVSYTGGSIAAGATCTVSVDVIGSVGGTMVNTTGSLTSSLGDSGTATDTLTVNAALPVTVAKSFSATDVEQGETIAMSIVLDNPNSFVSATGVTLTDSFPAGLTAAGSASGDAGCAGGSVTSGAGSVGFTGTLTAGQTCTISIDVTVNSAGPTLSNTASVDSDLNASPDTDGATVNIAAAVPPTLTKAFDAATADLNEPVGLTITLQNTNAFVDVGSVSLIDALPSGMTLATAASGSADCVGTVTGAVSDAGLGFAGSVAAGRTCTITAQVITDAPGTFANEARFTSDLNALAVNDSDTLVVSDPALPTIAKSFLVSTIDQGETVEMRIEIGNPNLFAPITGVAMTDTLPAGLEITTAASAVSGCSGGSVSGAVSAAAIGFAGTLAPDSTCVVTATLTATGSGAIINTADVVSDLNASPESDSATVTVTPAALPQVTKSFNAATALQGETVGLLVTIRNTNAFQAFTNVDLTDSFPAGIELASDAGATSGCVGGTVTGVTGDTSIGYSGGTIAPNSVCSIVAQVLVTGTANLTNTASVTTDLNATPVDSSANLAVTPADGPVITKSFDLTQQDQGGPLLMQITLTNPNTFQTNTNVVLTDTFPAGLELFLTPGGDANCVGGTVTGDVGDTAITFSGFSIAPGLTCTFSADLRLTGGASFTNTASVISDQNSTPNQDSASVTVTPANGPVITKTFSQPAADQGETVSMTIGLENDNAFQRITGISLTDTFPAGLVVAGNPTRNDCPGNLAFSIGGGTLDLTGAEMVSGSTCAITLPVQVTGAANLTNTASVTSDFNATANDASASLTVTAASDPVLTKSFSAASAEEGETLTMTLTVANQNTFQTVDAITLTDSFPAGLTITDAASGDAACSGGSLSGGTGDSAVSWTGGEVAPGETCTITVGVQVTGGSDVSNTASLNWSLGSAPIESTANLTVTPATAPTVIKAFDAAAADQGETVGMTLTVSNPNTFVTIGAIDLTDALPAGLELAGRVSGSQCGSGALSGPNGGDTIAWTGGTLTPGRTCTISAQVLVTGASSVTNTVSVLSDRNSAAVTASDTLTVTAAVVPTLTKAFSASGADEGETLSMTLAVTNPNAFYALSDLTLTDAFPAGLEIATDAAGDAACAGGTVTGAAGDSSVGWTGGTLAPGATCTITVGVIVTGMSDLTNTASLTSDLNATAIQASDSLLVNAGELPTLTKTFSAASATQGETVTMTVTIGNGNSFIDIADLALADPFPTGLEIASDAGGTGCDSGVLTGAAGDTSLGWTGGTLAAGETCTITVDVTVTGNANLSNTASLTSDRNASAITSTAALGVVPADAPELTKSFSAASATEGETVGMTLTVTNPNTFQTIGAIALTDAFPAGLELAGDAAGDATCASGALTGSAGDSSVGWTGGTLAPGETCTITADVILTGGSSLTNTASVVSDLNATAVTASAALAVTSAVAPTVAKSFSVSSVDQGENLTMTLAVTNPNTFVDVTSIDLTDAFPAGLTIGTAASGNAACASGALSGAVDSDSVSWTGGTLAAGETCTITVGVTVTGNSDLTNTVSVLSDRNTVAVEDSAGLRVAAAVAPTLSKSFSAASATQGEALTMTLAITNPNPFQQVADITLSDAFPAGLEVSTDASADATCAGGTLTGAAGDTSVGWTGGTLAANQTCNITVGVTVTGDSDLTNTASITSDLNATAIDASAPLTVTAALPPVLTKTFSASTAEEGQALTMTLSVENTNAFQAISAIDLADAFPAGLEISTAASGAGACGTGTLTGATGDGAVSWTGATLAPGESCAITVGVTVTGNTDLTNTASVTSDLNATAIDASASLAVTPAVDPVLTKTFSSGTAVEGETLSMTLAISNPNGFVDFTGVTLTDAFPAGLAIAEAPTMDSGCAGTLTGAAGDTSVGLTGGTVAAGAICTVTVDVTVTGDSDLTNTASVTSDRNATPVQDSAALTVTAATGPTLAKTFSATDVEQGQTVTMTLTLENPNPFVDIAGVSLADAFPAGLVVASAPTLDAGCTAGTLTGAAGDTSVGWTGGTLAVGATCALTVDVTVTGEDDLTNTASVTSDRNASATEASASLTVTPAAGPVLTKAFAVSTAEPGEEVSMTLTLENPNAFLVIDDIALTDAFPAGLQVASAVAPDAGCTGGALAGAAGDTSVSWSDGSLAPGATCTLIVGVVATDPGALTNTASVTSEFNDTATESSANLQVTDLLPPALAKSFSAAAVTQGESLTMTLAITNPNGFRELTDVALTDSFPAGLVISTAATAGAACDGGTVSGAAGDSTVTYSGGTLAAGATCTVTVGVTVPGTADLTNTASVTSSVNTTGVEDSATLAVTPAPPPSFTMQFAPATITRDETTRVLFTIDNGAALVAADALAFSHSFDGSVVFDTVPALSNSCGGTVSLSAGASDISLSGASLAPGASCQVAATLTGTAVGVFPESAGPLTSSLGSSGNAGATLTVEAITTGQITIVQRADPDGTFAFSSLEPALNFQIQTTDGEGSFGPVTLTAGDYRIEQARPEGFGNLSIACNDSDSGGRAREGILNVRLQAGESVTCFVASLQTDQKTIETINRFLFRRADYILSSEPNMGRRIDRLLRGFGNASPFHFSTGDLMSFSPVEFDPMSLSSKNIHLSGSLLSMRQAGASLRLAHGGETEFVDNYRWDAWFEAQYKKFDDSDGTGHFGIVYLGADYLVNENLLVGVMAHVDTMEETSDRHGTWTEGTGWMVGPYMTARLAPNLYFDARVAAGSSTNRISPFGTYTDTFDTTRWMAMMNLSGEFQRGPWSIRPNASLAYYEETQKGYVDTLGVAIPSQTIGLGQFKIGPTVSGTFTMPDGTIYQPFFSLEGIYNMGHTMGVTLVDDTPRSEGWRGRFQTGISFTTEGGAQISLGATYDGLFRSDYETYGFTLDVSIPLSKPTAH